MKQFFIFVLLFAVQSGAAPATSDLRFGNLQIQLPEKFFFTPLPSQGSTYGEAERSTILVSVKSTLMPRYDLHSANRIWNQNLKMAGMKPAKNACSQKTGFILCQQNEKALRFSLAFSPRQILSIQHKAKTQSLTSQDDIRISESK